MSNITTDANTSKDKVEIEKNDITPKFINLQDKLNPKPSYAPVIDVGSKDFKPNPTVFQLLTQQGTTLDPTPSNLIDNFLPLTLIDLLVKNSNTYIMERKRRNPNLYVWTREMYSSEITRACVYQFLAILYYFGICRLPSKRDYWSTDRYMPQHAICGELGMSRGRFEFMWRHFKIAAPDNDDYDHKEANDGANNSNDEDGDDAMQEIQMERVMMDQEEEDEYENNNEEENEEEEEDNEVRVSENKKKNNDDNVWFNKIKPLVDHLRMVSYNLIFSLGTLLSFDEMMIRFSGRSIQTHRIKNKPIGEGYKFFVLATNQGYVVNFTPDGRCTERERARIQQTGNNCERVRQN